MDINYFIVVFLGTAVILLIYANSKLAGDKKVLHNLHKENMKYLNEISADVSSGMELGKTLAHIIDILARKLKHEKIFMYTLEEDYDNSHNIIKKWLKCIAIPGSISTDGFAPFLVNPENESAILFKSITEKKLTTINMPDKLSQKLGQVKFTAIPITSKGLPTGLILTHPMDLTEDILFFTCLANLIGVAFENARLNNMNKELAITDDLTKIYNYRYFQKKVPEELGLARRYKNYLSFLMIDIDDFNHYNETNGTPAGDICLCNMAQVLSNTVRTEDSVFRYGGSKFSIILPATDKNGAMIVGDKLKKALGDFPFANSRRQPKGKLTVSIGITTYPNDAHNSDELIEFAEKALYAAKSSGKDKVCLYHPIR